MNNYFGCHNHTIYSNIRLLDSINTVKSLIDTAIKLGLSGIAITDHECLSAHIEAEKYMKNVKKEYPDFKLALGNEIYLVDERAPRQKCYHFILIAKDAIGHRALRELSSKAWLNSFKDRKQERVPTTKDELTEIVNKFKGHLIATTACIGGELPQNILLYLTARKINDMENAVIYYNKILSFLDYCVKLFGNDFYIECAPGTSEEQVQVNQTCRKISEFKNIKMVVATDAHYPTKNDRQIHKAYLNSKEGDREVDSFYEFTYLMDYDEVSDLLNNSFDSDFTTQVLNNTLEIENKIEEYSLFHKQNIPPVEVKDYPKKYWITVNDKGEDNPKYPHLSQMLHDDDIQNRYWVNQCIDKLYELGILDGDKAEEYLTELEEEARVKSIIGEKLETNMFRYPNTLQHYIDLMWDCGSMVGAGRGSSCAALNHYLMGITQLDPIKWNLPFFRYMNDERVELGSLVLILPSCKKRV